MPASRPFSFFSIAALLLAIPLLTACGVQRPLIRPSEIPAYEEQQRKKQQKIIDEQRELDAIDAKHEAERNAVVTPVPEQAN